MLYRLLFLFFIVTSNTVFLHASENSFFIENSFRKQHAWFNMCVEKIKQGTSLSDLGIYVQGYKYMKKEGFEKSVATKNGYMISSYSFMNDEGMFEEAFYLMPEGIDVKVYYGSFDDLEEVDHTITYEMLQRFDELCTVSIHNVREE